MIRGRRLLWAGGALEEEPFLLAAVVEAGAVIVRRCVDAADLLAAAMLEPAAVVVLSATLPRLDAEVVERVAAYQRPVIGLAADAAEMDVLTRWAVTACVGARDVDDLIAMIDEAVPPATGIPATDVTTTASPASVAPTRGDPASGVAAEAGVWTAGTQLAPPSGAVIAVWGAAGAPGRSRTALGIADEIARSGQHCCLIDADLRAPSLDLDLGVVSDTSGLLVLGRQADRGLLTEQALLASAREVRTGLALVTGLPVPHHYGDIRPAAMRMLVDVARASFDVVVIDVGAVALEPVVPTPSVTDHDEHAVARVIIERASLLVAVTRDEPCALARLARAWAAPVIPAVVALVSSGGPGQARATLRAAGVRAPIEVVRRDASWERAARTGATLAEIAPRSRTRRDYARLVALLPSASVSESGPPSPHRGGRLRRARFGASTHDVGIGAFRV